MLFCVFTYDRLGRQKTVSDYVGNRSFNYNADTLQLESENITGVYNKTITRSYETSGVVGRNNGFTIGSEYGVTYGYEANTEGSKGDGKGDGKGDVHKIINFAIKRSFGFNP